MNEGIRLQISQKQTIVTAAMMTSLHILQMNNLQLHEYVQGLADSNVAIDIAPLSETGADEQLPVQFDYCDPHMLWQEYSHRCTSHTQPEEEKNQERFIHNVDQEKSSNMYLRMQINALKIPRQEQLIVAALASLLDRNGRLVESDEELAGLLGQSADTISRCVKILQSLDPAGIGARSLSECLLLQLQRCPEDTTVAQMLVCDHLPELSKKKLRTAARAMGVSLSKVETAYAQILALNPKPLNGLFEDETISYVIPDIHVVREGDSFRCILNDRFIPKIRIDRQYLAMLQDGMLDASTREYLQKCCNQAGDITRYIVYRESTLQQVMEYIIQAQRQFFLLGPGYRTAMSNREIAEALNLHDSTISRAINGKYFDCSWGVFPLKALFTRSLLTTDRMDCVDYDKIVTEMKRMIDAESGERTLSDQMITEALNNLGISISRRTVSKYRQQLGIPSAAARACRRRCAAGG